MGKAINILDEWNKKKRKENVFDFGSFKGEPSFLLNIGKISSDGSPGIICEKAECEMRLRFFDPLTIDGLDEELSKLLSEELDCEWLLEKGNFKAQPAMVRNDDLYVIFIERCIEDSIGKQNFIHQYHGGSDIRFPILYGEGRCVGIGPYCELPEKGSGKMESIDIDDYLNGIAILANILLSYE